MLCQLSYRGIHLETARPGHDSLTGGHWVKKNRHLHVGESNPGRLRDRQKCYQLHQHGLVVDNFNRPKRTVFDLNMAFVRVFPENVRIFSKFRGVSSGQRCTAGNQNGRFGPDLGGSVIFPALWLAASTAPSCAQCENLPKTHGF